MILNEYQSHQNWYNNAEFICLYYHTKIARNLLVYVQMQANIKIFWMKSQSRVLSLYYQSDKIKLS